jgi:hypothetical protein
LAIEKTINKLCIWGIYVLSHEFLANYQGYGGILIFSHWFLIFNQNVVSACSASASEWMAFKSFRCNVWCHSMTKPDILLSLWICHHVLFYMVWHMTAYGSLIVNNDRFFFLFSLLPGKGHDCSFFFFSISVLILLIFYYVFFSFIEVFFNLVIQLQFLICFVFHFGLFFLIVFLDSFVKGFFDFQFHHSIKVFVVLLFSFWPLFFWFFFLLVKAIFQFNLTLQLKIFICPLIHFFSLFSPLLF